MDAGEKNFFSLAFSFLNTSKASQWHDLAAELACSPSLRSPEAVDFIAALFQTYKQG